MKRKKYQQPAIEVVEAAPAALLAGSLTEEGETVHVPVFDGDDDKFDYAPL